MLIAPPDPDRRRHYRRFYAGDVRETTGPIGLVHGNCQAESLRVVLDGPELDTVRIPPVHELTVHDLPHLRRWAGHAHVIVSQPIRRRYRGLPIGTADVLAAARRRTRTVIVPVVRFAGLYPEHALVRPAEDPSATPPLVPYHSLRVLCEAAGRRSATPLSPAAVRAVAAESLGELRRRERDHGTVVISDVFRQPSFELMRTLNHPGNPVWMTLATLVRDRIGGSEPVSDPGRPLLDAIRAPREPAVFASFGLDEPPQDHWLVHGRQIDVETVREAHLHWYAARPDVVREGLCRHAGALTALGLR